MAGPEELELRLQELQAQLLAAQSRLKQAERLAVVGSLVNEIAHEINTPLAALQSNHANLTVAVQRLRGLIGSSRNAGEGAVDLDGVLLIIEEIIKVNRYACERILSVARALRRSPELEDTEFVRANVQEEIDGSLALLAHAFRNRIRLVRDYGDLPEIECNPGRLGQVFLNILLNAVQAIEGEGEIGIRTWQEEGTVRVAIRDSGKGIPAALKSRIFDPGFTTRSAEKGMGIGLSICARIVRQHGGSIEVESAEGRGTTFTIILPVRAARERKTHDGSTQTDCPDCG